MYPPQKFQEQQSRNWIFVNSEKGASFNSQPSEMSVRYESLMNFTNLRTVLIRQGRSWIQFNDLFGKRTTHSDIEEKLASFEFCSWMIDPCAFCLGCRYKYCFIFTIIFSPREIQTPLLLPWIEFSFTLLEVGDMGFLGIQCVRERRRIIGVWQHGKVISAWKF